MVFCCLENHFPISRLKWDINSITGIVKQNDNREPRNTATMMALGTTCQTAAREKEKSTFDQD
jgi:hypothetical protein